MGEAARRTATIVLVLMATVALAACGGGSDAATNEVSTGPLEVTGAGAASYKHHDSVSTWGSEASKAELAKAAEAEHAYLVARAEGDWAKACSYIGEGLEQRLAANSASFAQQGCAKALASMSEPIPASSAHAATAIKADSLRASGFWAFLLYRAGGERYFMPMAEDRDGWKVNKIEPRPFASSASAKS